MCRTAIAPRIISQRAELVVRNKATSLDALGCIIVAVSPALIDPYPLCYEARPRGAATTRLPLGDLFKGAASARFKEELLEFLFRCRYPSSYTSGCAAGDGHLGMEENIMTVLLFDVIIGMAVTLTCFGGNRFYPH